MRRDRRGGLEAVTQPPEMGGKIAFAEIFGDDALRQESGEDVKGSAYSAESWREIRWNDEVTQPDTRQKRLAERARREHVAIAIEAL